MQPRAVSERMDKGDGRTVGEGLSSGAGHRTAFTLSMLHRHTVQGSAARITCVALDTSSQRMFLGLASGVVMEYQLTNGHQQGVPARQSLGPGSGISTGHAASSSGTRLVAEKRVSRQALLGLACLPPCGRLLCLSEDGVVTLASYDTWALQALQGVRSATAMAVDAASLLQHMGSSYQPPAAASSSIGASSAGSSSSQSKLRPVRIAVAVKGLTSKAKLLVYSVAVAGGVGGLMAAATAMLQPPTQLLAQVALPDHVSALAWAGDSIVALVGGVYTLVQSGGRVSEIAPYGGPADATPFITAGPLPYLAAAPHARMALLTMLSGGDGVGGVGGASSALLVAADANGSAVREPISLNEAPLALAEADGMVVAVVEDHILVHDAATSRQVQDVAWSHDDAHVAACHCIPSCVDAAGGGEVLLAAAGGVMALRPVAAEAQVLELLRCRRYHAGVEVAQSQGLDCSWAGTAQAQAALLMMQELRFEEALDLLAPLPLSVWQPAQVLALLPSHASRWLAQLPSKSYWRLHGPALKSLETLCEDFFEPSQAGSGTGSGGGGRSPTNSAATPIQPGHAAQQQLQQQLMVGGSSSRSSHDGTRPGPGATNVRVGEEDGSEPLKPLFANAKSAIASYILKVRRVGSTGLLLAEALDSVAAMLLSETGRVAELEGLLLMTLNQGQGQGLGQGLEGAEHLRAHHEEHPPSSISGNGGDGGGVCVCGSEAPVQGGHCVLLPALVPVLERDRRWHALALLRAGRGYVAQALDIWSRLAQGSVTEGPSDGAAAASPAAAAEVAARHAGQLMCNARACPPLLCLSKLPWLLTTHADQALAVMRARELPVNDVLALLQGRTDGVRWQYLHHLVYTIGGPTQQQQSIDACTSAPASAADPEPALHTELALELVELVTARMAAATPTLSNASGTSSADADYHAAAERAASGASAGPSSQHGTSHSQARPHTHHGQHSHGQSHRRTTPSLAPPHDSLSLIQVLAARSVQSQPQNGQPDMQLGAGQVAFDCVPILRAVLQHHLASSPFYDAGIVLAALGQGPLLRERVLAHRHAGQHPAALRLLGLELGDVPGAVAYCRHLAAQALAQADAHSPAGGLGAAAEPWLTLLDILLRPGDAREPQYQAAVRVLAAEGAALAPMQVMAALGDELPMSVAAEPLRATLAATLHKKRQAHIIRSLQRGRHLALAADLAALRGQCVVVGEDSRCRGCSRPLDGAVFTRMPTGVLLCGRCAPPAPAAQDAGVPDAGTVIISGASTLAAQAVWSPFKQSC